MDNPKMLEQDSGCGGAEFDILKCSICTQPCLSHHVAFKLRDSGLRCTRQRTELARLLFANGDRHFTADLLYSEAKKAKIPVSLATIYNTLQHFAKAGLIRRLATGGQKTWFDTNTSEHHHLYYEEEGRIVDVPEGFLSVANLPPVPKSLEIERVDVVIHLKRRDSSNTGHAASEIPALNSPDE